MDIEDDDRINFNTLVAPTRDPNEPYMVIFVASNDTLVPYGVDRPTINWFGYALCKMKGHDRNVVVEEGPVYDQLEQCSRCRTQWFTPKGDPYYAEVHICVTHQWIEECESAHRGRCRWEKVAIGTPPEGPKRRYPTKRTRRYYAIKLNQRWVLFRLKWQRKWWTKRLRMTMRWAKLRTSLHR